MLIRVCIVAGLLGAGWIAASEPAPRLDDVLGELRAQYPDRESVIAHCQEIANRLYALGEASPTDVASEELGRAWLLAAEILFVGGRGKDARDLLGEVASRAPREEDRARALYLLGESYFLRERYRAASQEGSSSRANATYYWGLLAQRFPQSSWARRIERPLRYLRILGGAPPPECRALFRTSEGEREISLEGLRGKVVVLDFWSSSSRGQRDFERRFARDLRSVLDTYPDLEDRIEILGVNLDVRRESFEAAVKEWGMPWPQHHDGLGFRTPVAEAFGIPRDPHCAVLDPAGTMVYLGADRDAFFRALSAELRRIRSDATRAPSAAGAEVPGAREGEGTPPAPPPSGEGALPPAGDATSTPQG